MLAPLSIRPVLRLILILPMLCLLSLHFGELQLRRAASRPRSHLTATTCWAHAVRIQSSDQVGRKAEAGLDASRLLPHPTCKNRLPKAEDVTCAQGIHRVPSLTAGDQWHTPTGGGRQARRSDLVHSGRCHHRNGALQSWGRAPALLAAMQCWTTSPCPRREFLLPRSIQLSSGCSKLDGPPWPAVLRVPVKPHGQRPHSWHRYVFAVS